MNPEALVLIVEDDAYILRLCAMILTGEHYRVLEAKTGREALELFHENSPDILLLDLGLPDADGMDLIPLFRQQSRAPILVISARSEESEKIRALDLGADDYLSKPFHTGELMARIRVAQRRTAESTAAAPAADFSCGDLYVDFSAGTVALAGAPVHLTAIEYRLLCLLIRNRGKVLTHRYIQTQIWGDADGRDAQNLRVFMASLRRKVGDGQTPYRYILTQVGVGYWFTDHVPAEAPQPEPHPVSTNTNPKDSDF